MGLNAAKAAGTGGRKADALDADNYPARVVQIIDMGVQKQRPYKGEDKPPVQELMVTYELGTEFMLDDDGNPDESKPRWISERFPLYNLKAEKAKSTKRYTAIDPKLEYGGDFSQLVGKACLVTVVNNEKNGTVYNNVGNVSQPVKGMQVAELVNEGKFFDLSDPDLEVFESLPDWIQGIIKEGLDYPGSLLATKLGETPSAPAAQVEEQEDDFPV